jgi:tetratricopeptide (TPR) repeat protein
VSLAHDIVNEERTALLTIRNGLLPGLFVAFIAFLVYANSLGNGFVMDDNSVILNNPVLQGTPLSVFRSMDTTSDATPTPYYRPLTYLTFMLEGRMHGFNPFFVRLFNVLLHAVNALLVYLLARTLLHDSNAALIAGLFFAVHPLHTEGVDFNAGGRNTLLACSFVLGTYLIHRESVLKNSYPLAVGGTVFFLAGLFSKESAAMISPFIVALELGSIHNHKKGDLWRSVLRLIPYAVAAGFYLILRAATLSAAGVQEGVIPGVATSTLDNLYVIPDLGSRLFNNVYIIPRYLLTVLYPVSLSSLYDVPEDLHVLALPLAFAWLAILGGLWWLVARRRSRTTLFGIAWLICFWVPVSGIVWFASSPLADRYLYLPAIGLWIIVADQLWRLFPPNHPRWRPAAILVLVVFVVLSFLTIRRNKDWKDNITLFTRVTEQYPENPYGHAYLGDSYFLRHSEQDLRLAEVELEKALDLQPEQAKNGRPSYSLTVYNKLGHIKVTRDDYEGALHYYSQALSVYPLDREALLNRGMTFDRLGRFSEAFADYSRFLSAPGSAYSEYYPFAAERIRRLKQ